MKVEYERVNEPLMDKLERAAANYEKGRIACDNPQYVARQLKENAERIRRMHADKANR